MNIGSRPAKRKPNAGIESLRAIPWIFAWTQTRLHLPVWLGIGSALSDAVAAGQLGTLQEMYASWPFLAVTMDMARARGGFRHSAPRLTPSPPPPPPPPPG